VRVALYECNRAGNGRTQFAQHIHQIGMYDNPGTPGGWQ
jgi:hypothetical protein